MKHSLGREQPPDVATSLHRLRCSCPQWAFLHDPVHSTWIALRGRGCGEQTLVRSDPISLQAALDAAGATPRT